MVKCSHECFTVSCPIMTVFIYHMCRHLCTSFISWNTLEKTSTGGSCYAFMEFILLLKKPGLVVLPLYDNCAQSVKTDACVDGSVETFA